MKTSPDASTVTPHGLGRKYLVAMVDLSPLDPEPANVVIIPVLAVIFRTSSFFKSTK